MTAKRFENSDDSNRNTEAFRGLNDQQARINADYSPALANDNYENWSRNVENIRDSWAPLSLNNAFDMASSARLATRPALYA